VVTATPIGGRDSDGTLYVKGPDGSFSEVFAPDVPAMAEKASLGDYAVIYEDGYKSVSPKAAFEDGYTLVED
jgi:hypothetical protein